MAHIYLLVSSPVGPGKRNCDCLYVSCTYHYDSSIITNQLFQCTEKCTVSGLHHKLCFDALHCLVFREQRRLSARGFHVPRFKRLNKYISFILLCQDFFEKSIKFLKIRKTGKIKFWWRHRDLNSGHCGYEPHALAN